MKTGRKYYPGITIFKLIGCVLILVGHVVMNPQLYREYNHEMQSSVRLFSVVVPCFYIISGFLAYQGWKHAKSEMNYIKNYLKWILIVYGFFCVIAFFNYLLPEFIHQGINSRTLFHLVKLFFIKGPYGQLWFIPPLIVGVAASYYFYYKKKLRFAAWLAGIGFVFSLITAGPGLVFINHWLGHPHFLQSKAAEYVEFVISSHLGFGFPFVLAGLFIARHEERFFQYALRPLLIIAIITTVAEVIFLKVYTGGDYEHRMFLNMLPNSVLLFYGILKIKMAGVKKHHSFINLLSIVIFFSQFVLIYINLGIVHLDLWKLTPYQKLVCIVVTLIEAWLLTMLIQRLRKRGLTLKGRGVVNSLKVENRS